MNGQQGDNDDSDESDDYTKPGPRRTGPSGAPGSEAFARSAARQSLGNNPALLRWLDAQVRPLAVEQSPHCLLEATSRCFSVKIACQRGEGIDFLPILAVFASNGKPLLSVAEAAGRAA